MILEVFIKSHGRGLAVLLLAALLVLFSGCGEEQVIECHDGSSEVSVEEKATASGYGVYVDGVFVAAVEDNVTALDAIEDLTDALAASYGMNGGHNQLQNDVRVVNGIYNDDAFTDPAGLSKCLGNYGNRLSFSVTDVYGAELPVKFSVISKVMIIEEEGLAYTTEVKETDALSVGTSVVITEGVNGVKNNTYSNTYVNGVCVDSFLANSTVVSEPVSALIWQGTENGASLMAAGEKLALPYDGRVSSGYGWRVVFGEADFHEGVDFIAHSGSCYGDEIYSSADGVVVYAGWHSGYGLKVVIDHGDGLSTLYAHCSKLLVEEGQAVLKGQAVALMGATGRVTGPHLHYGVLIDGDDVNPELYLDWNTFNGTNK